MVCMLLHHSFFLIWCPNTYAIYIYLLASAVIDTSSKKENDDNNSLLNVYNSTKEMLAKLVRTQK